MAKSSSDRFDIEVAELGMPDGSAPYIDGSVGVKVGFVGAGGVMVGIVVMGGVGGGITGGGGVGFGTAGGGGL